MVIIAIMSFLGRVCGASWNKIPQLGVLFALPFGWVLYQHTDSLLLFWLGACVSYLAFQTGHGNFYQMKGVDVTKDEPETLEWLVRKFYKNIHTSAYSWLCMGLKGLLIGSAAFPYGLALAVLWPFSYWLSFRFIKSSDSALAEYLAGAFAGLIIWLSL